MALGNLSEGIIPVSQAFFVKANAANPVLTIPSDARVHAAQQFYAPERDETNLPLIVLEVAKGEKNDEIWVAFHSNCTEAYDNGYDVYKKFGDIYSPQFYMKEGDLELSINALPELPEAGKTIPIGFLAGENGPHEIQLKNFAGLENIDVILEDQFAESFQVISEMPSYSFFANTNDSPDRFLLHIGANVTDIPETEISSDYYIYANKQTIYIKRIGEAVNQKIDVMLIDLFGRTLLQSSFSPSHLNAVKSNLNDNIIIVRVTDENGNITTRKVFVK